MLIRRMPLGVLPVPPRWGIALPSLLMSCILFIFELSQGQQCLLEVSSMPYKHRVGTNCVRTDPPIVAVHTNFFFSSVVCVILVRQFVHLTTFLHCDPIQSCSCGTFRLGWTSRGYPSRTSRTSSWANWRCSTRDLLASSRNGAPWNRPFFL